MTNANAMKEALEAREARIREEKAKEAQNFCDTIVENAINKAIEDGRDWLPAISVEARLMDKVVEICRANGYRVEKNNYNKVIYINL